VGVKGPDSGGVADADEYDCEAVQVNVLTGCRAPNSRHVRTSAVIERSAVLVSRFPALRLRNAPTDPATFLFIIDGAATWRPSTWSGRAKQLAGGTGKSE
jgi:hypothetical protein